MRALLASRVTEALPGVVLDLVFHGSARLDVGHMVFHEARVSIWSPAKTRLRGWVQAADGLEAGGVLVGLVDGHNDAVGIGDVSEPLPLDGRGPRHWHMRDPGHQQFVTEAWGRRGLEYLGRWHTHPEPEPSPSAGDLDAWFKDGGVLLSLQPSRAAFPRLLEVIVGQTHLGLWEIVPRVATVARRAPVLG